jgi:uncharacterized protein YaiL (DUF2058 family)
MDDRYELLPRAAGDKVRERDRRHDRARPWPGHRCEAAASTSEDDAYYAQFKVPDDLVW